MHKGLPKGLKKITDMLNKNSLQIVHGHDCIPLFFLFFNSEYDLAAIN